MEKEGIQAEVVDLRSLLPLDMETVLASARKTRRAVVVHSATTFAGPGAEVAAQLGERLFGELAEPVQRVGAKFTPIPARASEATVTITVDGIVKAARKALGAVNV